MMRRLPLRARLALLTALAVALAVAAASVACWFLTKDQLMAQMDRTLADTPIPRPPMRPDRVQSPTDVCRVYIFIDEERSDSSRVPSGPFQAAIQVITADGVVCTQNNADPVSVTQADRDVASGTSRKAVHNATAQDGTRVRVITRPSPEGPGYAVTVARPLTEIDNSLDSLALWLTVVSGIGVIAAATVGLFIARAALRPVDQLTDVVEHIARTEDLDAAIPVEGKDEIARLGTSFNSMTAALRASRDRQQQLIADAGHELRTPLTSLRTNTDLLLRSEEQGRPLPDDDKRRLLRNVRSQLRELSGLVGDLLELARPERNRGTPVSGVAALHEAVEHAVERARLRGPDVAFDVAVEPWYARGEESGLERAVLNLLDNAIKFGPADGSIEIRLREGELTVRDHGPGIDPTDAPRVFERFWRSDTARALPGSGLGLAIVARAVQESGGTVALEPAPGGGTVARMRLPGTATPPGGS